MNHRLKVCVVKVVKVSGKSKCASSVKTINHLISTQHLNLCASKFAPRCNDRIDLKRATRTKRCTQDIHETAARLVHDIVRESLCGKLHDASSKCVQSGHVGLPWTSVHDSCRIS